MHNGGQHRRHATGVSRLVTVNTVLGPLDTADLGFTLMHEHVLITSAGLKDVYPDLVPRDHAIAEGTRRLKEVKAAGVSTIVDLTTMDLGRDITVIREVAELSGVNIICATGTWLDIPRSFQNADPDDIARLYIREIDQGIENTGIRAGVIKVANDIGGVTPAGEVILRAAARAQKATGVPIITHTWSPEKVGDQQIAIFEDEGIDLNRVCVGHSNDTTDLDYLTGLFKKGVWVGMDRFPSYRPELPDWRERTRVLKKLMDAGWTEKLMVSHDDPMTMLIAPKAVFDERIKRNPDHICFIARKMLPYLRELGATEGNVRQITVNNPAMFFGGN
jgi:phosphotriesterase-related protein